MKLFPTIALLFVSLCGEARMALPDSLLTTRKAYCYNLLAMDTALAIVDGMRQQNVEPEWKLDMVEGDLYGNTRQFQKALPYYEKALTAKAVKGDNQTQLRLLKRIMDTHDQLKNDDELMKYIHLLRDKARKCHESPYIALANFMLGKRMHYHGQTEEGYKYCLGAVNLMKKSDYDLRDNELRAFYAELLKMYAREKRYDEALKMSYLQEGLAVTKTQLSHADDRARRRVYALRASLLMEAGQPERADSAYEAWTHTTAGNAIDDKEILGYLTGSRRYEEALDIVKRNKDFLIGQGDTLSERMLNMLNIEADIYYDMGEYKLAAEHHKNIAHISDTLAQIKSKNDMKTVYYNIRTNQRAERNKFWLIMLGVGILAIGILLGVNFYYYRTLKKRNRTLKKLIRTLNAYRHVAMRDLDGILRQKESDEKEYENENERLFVEMDKMVTRDKLFLNPNLRRDDLARLLNIDKNRLGKIIGCYSNSSNVSVYINSKRIEYGAELIKTHSKWNFNFVAEKCGMKSAVTFSRLFKEAFGVTPTEFRQVIENEREKAKKEQES